MNIHVADHLPSLEIDVLKTFVAIVETGSFAKAAQRVFRSPSAVSMQIKKLEDILGRPLFERDSRSVDITADGELLLRYARRILSLNGEIMGHFTYPDMIGTVCLGAPDDYGSRLLPIILKRFAESHPNIAVDVVIDSSDPLLNLMNQSQLDVIIYTSRHKAPLQPRESVLMNEQLAWVGIKNGCAHEKEPLPISVWDKSCSWRNAATTSLDKIGREYRIAYMSAQTTGTRASVLADLAIAPLPATLVEAPLVKLGAAHGLPELDHYQVRMMTADNLSRAAQAVADHVTTSFAAFTAGELECLQF
jgi:DNA-binding transcriptional LysR family regulator